MCPTITIGLEERIEKCEKILSANPDSLIFAALSDAYRKKGNLAKAFHICSRGLKIHPAYGPGHMVMVKINLERGMYCEAERELMLSIQADGKTRATELLRVQILIKRGQIKDAKLIMEKLKLTDPEKQVLEELLQNFPSEEEVDKSCFEDMAISEFWQVDKVADLEAALSYLKPIPGVLGVLVLGEDGSVLESKLNPHLKKEVLRDAVNNITREVKQGLTDIDIGDYKQIMVELLDLELWINRFDHRFLVLCCSPYAHLGALKRKVSEMMEKLEETTDKGGRGGCRI